ncbi:MAG: class I SAM-dependent methyltransferase [Nitrospirae bacterium]|nr:class I SAM-dependent methyltransferase [Nitrospirota bacterium]
MSRCATNFKDLASSYDAWYRTPLGAAAHALESDAIFALAEVKTGERVLDVGCGTGIYTLELARRDVHVVGVDPSMEMILIAREKVRQAGLKGYVICGSAEALPFRPERFDLALAVTSLCFVGRPDRAVEEMHRVLKSDGRIVVGELNRFSLWALLRRLKGLFMDTIYNRAHFWSRRELERLLRQSGFHPSAIRTLLYFPPVPFRTFLKSYLFFEVVIKKMLPGTGAFLAIKAERR